MVSERVRSLLSSSALVAVGLAVSQFLAYLLNLVAARALGPESFGAFAALMSVMLIASTVALGLQAATSKRIVATSESRRPAVGGGLLLFGLAVAAGLAAIALLASPLITSLVRLDSWLVAAMVAVIIGVFTLGGAQLGVTQGAERFGLLGLLYGSVQACRTLGAVTGALVAQTLFGTLLGLLLGTMVGVAVGQWIISPLVSRQREASPGIGGQVWHATHALLALFVLTNMDVLLARYFLDAGQAGIYAAGVLIAKVAFFLPQFVLVIAFPAMARRQDRRSVMTAAAATATIGLLVTVGVAGFSPLAVAAVGGSQYTELISEAWLFAAVGALFAVAQVLLYGQVARGSRWAVAFLWGVVVLFATWVALVAHDNVLSIVTTALCVAGLVVVAGVAATMRSRSVEPLSMNEIEEFLEQ